MATFIAVSLMKVEEEGYEPQYQLRVNEAATPTEFVELLRNIRKEADGPIEMICIQGNVLPMKTDGSTIEIAKNEYQLTSAPIAEYTNNPVYLGPDKGDTNE